MEPNDLQTLCHNLCDVSLEAGEITLRYFRNMDLSSEVKKDGSPVTLADQEAEAFIQKQLKDLLPDIPFIGEEAKAAGACDAIGDSKYYWMVDALDGTKEFISGSGEFTVNIALIYSNKPVVGIVYAPYLKELYGAFGLNSAFKKCLDDGTQESISVRNCPKEGLTVIASKSHGCTEKLDTFLQRFEVHEMAKRGSSLKICAIAEGKADLYPRFGPTCEWDTAAAQAVLEGAGGHMIEAHTQECLSYGHNREDKWLNPEFIASGFKITEN